MRKNGFTLIEIIVILIIIGLLSIIAVPSVTKVIENTSKETFISSVKNIEKTTKKICNMEIIDNPEYTDTIIIQDGFSSIPLGLEGDLPDGTISIDKNCVITYELTNNNYSAFKDNSKSAITINKCKENCVRYKEENLNGSIPNIKEGMIPVTIENDGTVKKADIFNEWYNYEEKKWANAILVSNESREKYLKANAKTVIALDDIKAYFVWIPRYKYKIPTGGTSTPSSIDIIFENKNIEKSFGNAKTEYLTHPAFTFGEDEVKGIWAGKFETSGTDENPTIKPNATILRNQNLNNQFNTSKKFNDYVFYTDAHMIKNSEWGAISYLSHSKYGIDGKIRINNNIYAFTGCGANNDGAAQTTECHNQYGKTTTYPQSTTGNITGVFDMSGGGWERVMSFFGGNLSNSGFTELPDYKYYDFYVNPNFSFACKGNPCNGHGLNETKGWYNSTYKDLNGLNSVFDRGGHYNRNTTASQFDYGTGSGGAGEFTSRTVISN